MNLSDLRSFMRASRIDAWLVHDFRGNNPVLPAILPGKRWTTRRVALWIPSNPDATPEILVHGIDMGSFRAGFVDDLRPRIQPYLTWQEFRSWIGAKVSELEGAGGGKRVAMEYAPGAALPVIAIVDAGTVELVRAVGAEVVSSADLVQVAAAAWTDEARRSHQIAGKRVARVKDEAFGLINEHVRSGKTIHEHDVQAFILRRFGEEGLETADSPVVAVNAHSGDPHYEASAAHPTPIRRGDWLMLDLWARLPGDENIFSDITWMAVIGRDPSERELHVFNAVRRARDVAMEAARSAHAAGRRAQGWQPDDAARAVIIDAGLGEFIRHRTGHSLSPGPKVHGMGVNLDNLETRDTRELLPRIGFTIEPGVYTPEFGVRLEVNAWVHPERGPELTSVVQEELVRLA